MPRNYKIPPITPAIVEAYARMQRAQVEYGMAQANLEAEIGGLPLDFTDFQMSVTADPEEIIDIIDMCVDQEMVDDYGIGRIPDEDEG